MLIRTHRVLYGYELKEEQVVDKPSEEIFEGFFVFLNKKLRRREKC